MSGQSFTVRQGIFIVVMYILGTAFLVTASAQARHDLWISHLLALAVSLLLAFLYGRCLNHFPDKDIFDTMEALLGKVGSRVLLALMTIYLFQFYSYVLRHFAGFINLVGIPEAPFMVPLVCIGLLSAMAVYYGIETLGKWSTLFLLPVALFIVSTALLLTQHMDINRLRPVLEDGIRPVLKGAWVLIALPYAEIVALLFVLPPFRKKGASYRVLLTGLLLGFAFVFLISVSDVMVMGADALERLYFPSFSTVSIIRVGNFIRRLEIVAASIFTVTIFFKASVLLLAVIRCIGRVVGLDEPRILVMPIISLAISYAVNSYGSSIEFYEGIFLFWPWYSSIFQILIPILLFALMEYGMSKRRKLKKQVLAGPPA